MAALSASITGATSGKASIVTRPTLRSGRRSHGRSRTRPDALGEAVDAAAVQERLADIERALAGLQAAADRSRFDRDDERPDRRSSMSETHAERTDDWTPGR